MVSAGLDTVPGNLIMGLAYLSTPHGQEIQEKALKEIEEVYPDGDAWEKCLVEEKVPYVTALVKETLRFWSVIPISLPRTSVKDIEYNGAVIPAGTTFFMVSLYPPCFPYEDRKRYAETYTPGQNAWAADYDPERFADPTEFRPERFLGDPEGGTPHYAYGAGSRMCAGSHLANRELFTAYIRLITAFSFTQAKDPKDHPIIDAIECNRVSTSLTTDPKPFKIGLTPRNEPQLREWIAEAEERTKDL